MRINLNQLAHLDLKKITTQSAISSAVLGLITFSQTNDAKTAGAVAVSALLSHVFTSASNTKKKVAK